MKTLLCGLLAWLLLAAPVLAQPAAMIGHVHNLQGTVSIIRGGVAEPATVGMSLERDDVICTGKPGAIGVVLNDDTTISLGPGSELALNRYDFNPDAGKLGLAMRLVRGTFSFITGLIGKLAPDSVELAIPDATIAVRGTKLLVEIED